MKICVIGSVGIPASYGGFETLAESLVKSDKAKFTVYCSSKHYLKRPKTYKNADLVYIPFDANGISSIFYDGISMLHALISGHKNFLILGVSGAIFFPILRLFPKVKIITNIDGIEWQRDKWKGFAKLFLKFSELLAVKLSSQIISDNNAITDHVVKRYKSSCKTIAYGGDHALESTTNVKLDDSLNANLPFALSICRIEPENNIHLVLKAFSNLDLPIIFVGNWDKTAYGKELFSRYKDKKNITLLHPIYCLNTLYALRSSCSIYIHGHSAGGTNPSLVEMMFFSKTIIAFDCSFNRATMEDKGDYFNNSISLEKIIKKSDSLTDGAVMVEIANRRYRWKNIREEYLELFSK